MAREHRKLPAFSPQDLERFWNHVDKTPGYGPQGDCWEWNACKGDDYGVFTKDGHNYRANRVAFMLYTGNDPGELCVLHRCDFPPCTNGLHLFTGTLADNNHDTQSKGRFPCGDLHPMRRLPHRRATGKRHRSRTHPELNPKGERNPQAKLNEAAVRDIRRLHEIDHMSYSKIAAIYHLNVTYIGDIVHRKRWKHVD